MDPLQDDYVHRDPDIIPDDDFLITRGLYGPMSIFWWPLNMKVAVHNDGVWPDDRAIAYLYSLSTGDSDAVHTYIIADFNDCIFQCGKLTWAKQSDPGSPHIGDHVKAIADGDG